MPHRPHTVARNIPRAGAPLIKIPTIEAGGQRAPDYRSLLQLRETLSGLRRLLVGAARIGGDSCAVNSAAGGDCPANQQLQRTGTEIENAILSLDAVLGVATEVTDLPGELPIMHFVNLFLPDRSLLRIFTRAHTWEVELPVPFPTLNCLEQPAVRELAMQRLRASGAPEEIIATLASRNTEAQVAG